MSPVLNINFEDVPDAFVPLKPGVWELLISEVPTVEPTKDGTSTKVVVTMKVADSPMNQTEERKEFIGRKVTDHISVKMETKLKRLCLSAGLAPGDGIDTEELLDQIVTVRIRTETYKTEDVDENGEPVVRETTRVADYLIPTDSKA